MPKEPYSVTRDGRLIIRDAKAILERQRRVMDLLDAIPDEDNARPVTSAQSITVTDVYRGVDVLDAIPDVGDARVGEAGPPPKSASGSVRSRKRPGKAG